MKKILPLFLLFALSLSAYAETTVTQSSFSSIEGYVSEDKNISYKAEKGKSSNAPVVNSNQIRIYQNGGLFTVYANNQRTITQVVLGSAMSTSVTYTIDGKSVSESTSIAKNGKLTISNLSADTIRFTCVGTTSSTRLYVNYISVTYTAADPCTVSFSTGTGASAIDPLTETTGGAGVTLPTPETDCGDWEFAGWAEAEVTTATTTRPTLFAAGATYKPAADCTLYAVYSNSESGSSTLPDNTTLWSETFAHFGTSTPSAAGMGSGTTTYGNATVTYTQSNTGTKGYNEKLAGGTAPELLLSKSSTWTIAGIPTGGAEQMTLTLKSNNPDKLTITATEDITCTSVADKTNKSFTCTLTNAKSVTSFSMSIAASANARIDDVQLVSSTATTTTYDSNPTCTAAEKHTISWYSNGVLYEQGEQTEGKYLTFPADPTRENFSFMGWISTADYSDLTTAPDYTPKTTRVSADAAYYAVWAQQRADKSYINYNTHADLIALYTVSCVAGDNTTLTLSTSDAYEGESVTATVGCTKGYTLSVLYNDGSDHTLTPTDGVCTLTMPAHDITITTVATPILVQSISLSVADTTLREGASFTLRATVLPTDALNGKVVYTIDDEDIATVSNTTITVNSGNAIIGERATITVTAADGSGVQAACTLTVSEANYYIYIDEMHGTATATFGSETKAIGRTVKIKGAHKVPSLADKESGTSGCTATHYHFVGWVESSISEGQEAEPTDIKYAGDAASPNSAKSSKTFYAVWAEEAE